MSRIGLAALHSAQVILSETLEGDKLVSILDGLDIVTYDIDRKQIAGNAQMQNLSDTQNACVRSANSDDFNDPTEAERLINRISQVNRKVEDEFRRISAEQKSSIESKLAQARMLISQNDLGPARLLIEEAEEEINRILNYSGGNVTLDISSRTCWLNRHENDCTVTLRWSSTEKPADIFRNGMNIGGGSFNGTMDIRLAVGSHTIEAVDRADDQTRVTKTVVVRKYAMPSPPSGKVVYQESCQQNAMKYSVEKAAFNQGFRNCVSQVHNSCDTNNEFILVCDKPQASSPRSENNLVRTLDELPNEFCFYRSNTQRGFIVNKSSNSVTCLATFREYASNSVCNDGDGTNGSYVISRYVLEAYGDGNFLYNMYVGNKEDDLCSESMSTPTPSEPKVADGCYENASGKELYVNGDSQHYCEFKNLGEAELACRTRRFNRISNSDLNRLTKDNDCNVNVPALRYSQSGRTVTIHNATSASIGTVVGVDNTGQAFSRNSDWRASGVDYIFRAPAELSGTFELGAHDPLTGRRTSLRVSF